jgi:hypothetical protein
VAAFVSVNAQRLLQQFVLNATSTNDFVQRRKKGVCDMRRNTIRTPVMLVAILLLPLLVLPAQFMSSLLIDGQQEQARVIQVQGKNYVEVDELARITGGSLRLVGNQIILTLPGSGDTSSQAVRSEPTPLVGYSRQFLTAGIEAMREILEWHAALKTAIEWSLPFSDESFEIYRREVQASLKFAEVAASTDMDQKAFPLLANEFNTMTALTDKYLKMHARMDYIEPGALSKDPLEQKLLTCWRSLESMTSSHQFVDDGSCR